jgi:hypothetical protein
MMKGARGILVGWLGMVFVCLALAQGPARKLSLSQLLSRVADQAESFRKMAPTMLADETLTQRTRRAGAAAEYVTHEVVSVYAYGGLPEAPTVIHEIRKVISVDGKQVTSRAKAREAMTLGLHSEDDKLKKKLLEDFEKNGLRGAVTDFGQVILLFSARHQKDFQFEQAGDQVVGVDKALVLKYKQTGGAGGVMVFRGNNAEKQALQGELLVRESDGMPLRVTMTSTITSKGAETKDMLEVNYIDSGMGCVVPSSVQHREYFKTDVLSENSFQYGPFRKIGDETR